ncbi:hypothetical protein [Patulibacter americanus]|uniref:hypothetical protein n=1 Tax=Patulibacter americanus TaxID=588672 RepID=UPI0003B42324|nr:hypothetical protein [Patulibacter americanus]
MRARPEVPPSRPEGSALRDPALWIGAAVAVLFSVGQTLLRGDALWGQSDGVYTLTAQLLLHGDDLYGRLVGAQPPITLYAGVPALAVSSTLDAVHTWMGLLQVAGGVCAGIAARRLTGSSVATALAPVLAVTLPWAVNQHGVYLPELVGLPFLLGGAVAAARGRTAPVAGVLLALAVFVKFPFALPALLVALVAADRGRTLRWLVGAVAAQAVVYTALFGVAMWEQTVLAQGQSGLHAWGALPGTIVQSGWTLLGVGLGAVALLARPAAWPADRAQLRTSVALAVGAAGTWVTSVKVGTSLYVLVPLEAALIPLALAGVVSVWRGDAWTVPPWLRRGAIGLVAALVVAQSLAVLLPPHNRFPWTRPGTAPAYGQLLSHEAVQATVAQLRACPADAPSGRLAYFAFLADRRMPDDQPDDFLPTKSPRLADVLARMRADAPVCPAP